MANGETPSVLGRYGNPHQAIRILHAAGYVRLKRGHYRDGPAPWPTNNTTFESDLVTPRWVHVDIGYGGSVKVEEVER